MGTQASSPSSLSCLPPSPGQSTFFAVYPSKERACSQAKPLWPVTDFTFLTYLFTRSRDVQVKDSEGAFFYQIITEKDESVKMAQVQHLLVQSFISADLILAEVRRRVNYTSLYFARLYFNVLFGHSGKIFSTFLG